MPVPEPLEAYGRRDVVIIGAGVIGLVTAWRALQRGLTVTLVDPEPGSKASHVAAGMLAPVSEISYGEEPMLRLGLASLDRYPAFVAELLRLLSRRADPGPLPGVRRLTRSCYSVAMADSTLSRAARRAGVTAARIPASAAAIT